MPVGRFPSLLPCVLRAFSLRMSRALVVSQSACTVYQALSCCFPVSPFEQQTHRCSERFLPYHRSRKCHHLFPLSHPPFRPLSPLANNPATLHSHQSLPLPYPRSIPNASVEPAVHRCLSFALCIGYCLVLPFSHHTLSHTLTHSHTPSHKRPQKPYPSFSLTCFSASTNWRSSERRPIGSFACRMESCSVISLASSFFRWLEFESRRETLLKPSTCTHVLAKRNENEK